MKKSVLVLFIISLLAMTSFVIAHNCGTGGEKGVAIGDYCADCGLNDGIWPEDFGADCEGISDPDDPGEEVIPISVWSLDNITIISITSSGASPLDINLLEGGEILYMVVTNTRLSEGTNITFDIYKEDSIIFGDTKIDSILRTVDADGKVIGIFEVNTAEDLEEGEYEIYFDPVGINVGNSLYVNVSHEPEDFAEICADYGVDDCDSNPDSVGEEFIKSEEDPAYPGCFYDTIGDGCNWSGSECTQLTREEAYIENADSCRTASSVICSYSGEKIGNCTIEDAFIVSYTNSTGSLAENCPPWQSSPIPCPRKLKVPFFGLYGFIVSFIMISLVYLFLIKRKEDL